MYNSEEEFLNAYDSSIFEKLSMTTDIVILSISDEITDNYRKNSKKHFSVLLVKRKNYPFKDKWCLPGGFVGIDEKLEDCAKRILAKETNLHNIYMEQLYTFSDIDRDPRTRVISTTYMALIDKNKLNEKICESASWFNINLKEENNRVDVNLNNGKEEIFFKAERIIKEQTTNKYKLNIVENNKIAFDHSKVILTAIERLRNKIEYTDIVFNMMPPLFTLGELQQVYEIILNKKILAPAFRRIIANKVEKTEETRRGKGHRPSILYRYKAI